ncbi:hypothetical protein AX17_007232 [Amanita inopinata Kibby_2008]|nr:hypothetical protein AX17_007232 [Amanita inopinata Kibby_2008]
MIFPFTFKFSVPDLINPFSLTASSLQQSQALVRAHSDSATSTAVASTSTAVAKIQPRPPRPSPSLTPPVIVTKKRSWEPAFIEPSRSTTALASSGGYLDTPTKYRDMASRSGDMNIEYHEVDTEELPPPAKRRRGLAGSIVSTALSAALIGTAVGLTVYRLWRDRGKDTSTSSKSNHYTSTEQLPPPPPYQQTEYALVPATPKSSRKHRQGAGHSKRSFHQHSHPHSSYRQRSSRARAHIPPSLTSGAMFTPIQPEFDFASIPQQQPRPEGPAGQNTNEVEDQMDWIGDKLSTLIAEGKRALGREVVVMSDSKEDEVDDGSGAWEDSSPTSDSEAETAHHRNTHQTPSRASLRRHRANTTNNSPSSSRRQHHAMSPPAVAPPNPAFDSPSCNPGPIRHTYSASTSSLPLPPPVTPRRSRSQHTYGQSLDSSPSAQGIESSLWISNTGNDSAIYEDIGTFESPELRESMEKARQRVLMMRAARKGVPLTEEWQGGQA